MGILRQISIQALEHTKIVFPLLVPGGLAFTYNAYWSEIKHLKYDISSFSFHIFSILWTAYTGKFTAVCTERLSFIANATR
jgi:hypothetical protein